jgi:hypothetical protein
MDVGDEARRGLRRWPEARSIAKIERSEPWIHRHPIAIAEAVSEVH